MNDEVEWVEVDIIDRETGEVEKVLMPKKLHETIMNLTPAETVANPKRSKR